MEDTQIKSELIEQLIEISKDAGKAIMEVYNSNFRHQIKEDLSPLTKADTLVIAPQATSALSQPRV